MRRWIKVRLKDTESAHDAADIVEWWKGDRRAAEHVVKAVRLYYDLLDGKTAVLAELFPFLAESISRGGVPAPARPIAPPVVVVREKSEDEDISDLLDSF